MNQHESQWKKLSRKLRSRSWSEIRFRLRQELTNFRLFALPPHLGRAGIPVGHAALPDPATIVTRLPTPPFAADCLRLADEVLHHRFPLLGSVLETGPHIHWRRDYSG